jgi:O-methyltransferase involved in polyketide biosynthesis
MDKVELTGDRLTLLATLYGKALDSRSAHPILGDRFADDVVRQLDYDFSRLKVPQGADISLPVRAKHLDGWTREFLAAHPRATVLHLGCGLDSRVFRVDPPPGVHWYEVDQPEVIALRGRVYPPRRDVALIGASVTEPGWLEELPETGAALVVAEGLVHYLAEADAIALFRRVVERFDHGELIFDAYSKWMERLVGLYPMARSIGLKLAWALDDPDELVRRVPRLRLVAAVPFLTLPELVERFSPVRRAAMRVLGRTGFVRRAAAR